MTTFTDLTDLIKDISSQSNFKNATNVITSFVNKINHDDFLKLVRDIGIIPEQIEHDSSEEKLFSKTSDIVLSRCFRELGLSSKAISERGDSADVIAKSIHGYNLVADAKAFRLSRTAKNQKDFKIDNLSNWRGSETDYAILVSPYFQYPKESSQIYFKALEKNVCLFSWEHMLFFLENNIKEDMNFTLERIWNISGMLARDSKLSFSNRKQCFFPETNKIICDKAGCDLIELQNSLDKCKNSTIIRGKHEIEYWNSEIQRIEKYTKEQAIKELIKSKKLYEKIMVIKKYISALEG